MSIKGSFIPVCEVFFPKKMSSSDRRQWCFARFQAIFNVGDRWECAVYEEEL
jgi:hypothetical protein